MELFFTFLVTVVAGVVCHLISKWLDRHDKGNKQPSGCFATIKRKEKSLDCTPLRSGDLFFAYMDFFTFLCLTALQHMQVLIARYISFSQNKNFILMQYSIRPETEVLNCLFRTIASLKFLVDAPTSPSKFCLALARTRQPSTLISDWMEYQSVSENCFPSDVRHNLWEI